MLKVCSKCGIQKIAASEFYKDSSRKDGLTPSCKECHRAYYKITSTSQSLKKSEAYRKNPAPAKARANARRLCKVDEIKAYKHEAYSKLSAEQKETKRAALRKWKLDNPAKVLANTRARQARKINATPKWLSKAHLKEIETYYKTAEILKSEFSANFHVDHIVPLRGRTVCGLHVPWNLQLLDATDNIIKSNKIYRDYL